MPRAKTRSTSEPPIPDQPFPEPALLPGQRAIPLYRKIGGHNRYPHTLRFAVVAYTILDKDDYESFRLFRWMASWSEDCCCYVAVRYERINGKMAAILLHREILGLSRNPGRGCDKQVDHLDHNPLNNTRANLRIATQGQNNTNQRRRVDATYRFRGVYPNGAGYTAQFRQNGSKKHPLPTVPLEAEAAFMYNHVVSLLRDDHAQRNDIPPNELPSLSRQTELIYLVETKLRALKLLPVEKNRVTSPGS